MKGSSFHLLTLGCPKNEVDSEAIRSMLENSGFNYEENQDLAELIIINTCTFIETAIKDSIDAILEVSLRKKKEQSVIIIGCLVQRYPHELFAELLEVSAFVGLNDYRKIPEIAVKVLGGERVFSVSTLKVRDFCFLKERKQNGNRNSYYVKIADGCSRNCAFCILPKLHGRYISRKIENIITEVRKLCNDNEIEAILIAQDTGLYGTDLYEARNLPKLIDEISGIDNVRWIRLLYLNPDTIDDALIEEYKSNPKLLRYIDMPIQHASDHILHMMNRTDMRNDIQSLISRLRKEIPGVVLRTSVIVGFPGETDDDFDQLKEFIMVNEFEWAGVFEYSPQDSTSSCKMKQCENRLIKQRHSELSLTQFEIMEKKRGKLIGESLELLVEGPSIEHGDMCEARSYREAPEIDGKIFLRRRRFSNKSFTRAKIVSNEGLDLIAEEFI